MADYAIICDSSSDLTRPLRERFGVADYTHGVIYHPDGHSEPISMDWDSMTSEQFYISMKEHKILYSTAAPVLGDVYAVFERQLAQGKDDLAIAMSTALSSTYSIFLTAAKELQKKYPERKIICVDSKRYSTSEGLLVVGACNKRASGMTIEQNAEALEQ